MATNFNTLNYADSIIFISLVILTGYTGYFLENQKNQEKEKEDIKKLTEEVTKLQKELDSIKTHVAGLKLSTNLKSISK